MSEATTAAATGDNGAAASATATTAAATSAATTSAAPAAPTGYEWLGQAPEDIAGFVANKGWDSPVKAVESYRNLEKHFGVPADKILRMPDFEKGDKAELDAFYTKLGRPADPNGYEIEVPQGADPSFAEHMKSVFLEAGLSKAQAAKLAKANNEFLAQATQGAEAQFQTAIGDAERALRQEWGAAFEQTATAAKDAAKAFGLDDQAQAKFARAVGPLEANRFFANIAQRMGEAQFSTGSGAKFGEVMTPAQAQARKDELMRDKEWTAKYLNNNTEAVAEMRKLNAFIVGNKP